MSQEPNSHQLLTLRLHSFLKKWHLLPTDAAVAAAAAAALRRSALKI
jgi:hypothetical protein